MSIVLIILAIIIAFFGLILFFRKVQYDHIHANLQKMVDEYGGEVVRTGRISMPVYHGKYKNKDLVINFSSVKAENGDREYYATFSYDAKVPFSFNIMSVPWLEAHPVDQNPDVETIVSGKLRISSGQGDVIRIFQKNPDLITELRELDNFVYFFSSVRGAMFEIKIPDILNGSKFAVLNDTLESMHRFMIALRKGKKR
jgi:hypothetical protein